jgi:hypothetical protein
MTQSYTVETPMDDFRKDFLYRGAVCQAAGRKRPDLVPLADECRATVANIDSRKTQLQQIEDDMVFARAVESAEKLEAVEAYDMVRKQLAAYDKGRVLELMPVPPSIAAKLALEKFDYRVSQAIAAIKTLPETHPVRRDFLPPLEREFAEFQEADVGEDEVRRALTTMKLTMTTFKAELAQLRDKQLGRIQTLYGDRGKVEFFTLPWRSTSVVKSDEPTPATAPIPA